MLLIYVLVRALKSVVVKSLFNPYSHEVRTIVRGITFLAAIYYFPPSMIETADSVAAMRFKATRPAENEK
jgi:hypothetical protein